MQFNIHRLHDENENDDGGGGSGGGLLKFNTNHTVFILVCDKESMIETCNYVTAAASAIFFLGATHTNT